MRLAILLLTMAFDVRSAADDRDLLQLLQSLAVAGTQQFDDQEVAAFVVRDGNGTMSLVMWPHTANRRSEHYEGAIPPGAVAIAHTHPLIAERPSRGDVELAQKTGLPVYVITRWNVYVADADGSVIAVISHKNWASARHP